MSKPPATTPHARQERRYKRIRLEQSYFLSLMNWKRLEVIHLPDLSNLPPDVEVLHIETEFASQTINLILWSATFPVVEPGIMIPVLGEEGHGYPPLVTFETKCLIEISDEAAAALKAAADSHASMGFSVTGTPTPEAKR